MRLDLPAVTRSADDLGQVRGVKSASAVNCVEVTMKVALDSEANQTGVSYDFGDVIRLVVEVGDSVDLHEASEPWLIAVFKIGSPCFPADTIPFFH